MRSVVFHLIDVTRQAVVERLSSLDRSGPDGLTWSLFDANIYVSFYEDLLLEAEPAALDALIASLGSLPAVSVRADISGRIPGDAEVRSMAAFLLSAFRGVACDDYTCHCWPLSEIESDATKDGHKFFDYAGWA